MFHSFWSNRPKVLLRIAVGSDSAGAWRGKTRHTATGGLTKSVFSCLFALRGGGNRDIVREAGVSITLGLFWLDDDFDLQEYP